MWALALALACYPSPERPASELVGAGTTVAPPEPTVLTDAFVAAGYTVQHGVFEFSNYENCCLPGASCLWNNPSTPYGVVAVPPSPGQVVVDPDVRADGLARAFHLRADEAVVVLGRTPPEALYMGFRSYLSWRWEGDQALLVIGSLGPSLNQFVIADHTQTDDVWDQPFAVVITADAAVEREVVLQLEDHGWDPRHVHADRIPPSLVRLGLDAADDTFAFVARVAVYSDPVAGAAYLADPGAAVLRLTPRDAEREAVDPHPIAPVPDRGAGTDEEAWRSAADALGDALRASSPDFLQLEAESNVWHYETYDCLEDNYCSGEIRDRYYARVPSFTLPDDGSFAVAYGVNHARTGKASYSNMSVSTVENQIGLEAVESDRFVGSARAWLPDHPLVDDLFVVTVARDCADLDRGVDTPPCVEVPIGCPGVDLTELLFVDFRAYLEPATGAAPLHAELVADRVIKFIAVPPL